MKRTYWFYGLLLVAFISLFSSCASRKEVVYFQNIESIKTMDSLIENNTVIQPNDILKITVTAADPLAVRPYNMLRVENAEASSGGQQSGYLVDAEGNIEFPELGRIKVSGFTRKELINTLVDRISVGVKNPIVNVTILNFKITVLGEVAKPNQYAVSGERITLIEALGMAGDLTIMGKRENILIMREADGKKTFERIDITQADFMNSDYYYLKQNDVVYVEPNGAKIQSYARNPNISLYFSAASFLITLFVLIFR